MANQWLIFVCKLSGDFGTPVAVWEHFCCAIWDVCTAHSRQQQLQQDDTCTIAGIFDPYLNRSGHGVNRREEKLCWLWPVNRRSQEGSIRTSKLPSMSSGFKWMCVVITSRLITVWHSFRFPSCLIYDSWCINTVFVSRTVGMTPEPFEHQLVHQMFNARLLVSNRLSLLFLRQMFRQHLRWASIWWDPFPSLWRCCPNVSLLVLLEDSEA